MRPILILTGIDLEARALARALELPALPGLGFRAFGRGRARAAAVGVRARLLDARWPSLLDGLDRPIVVSAGVCGALAPGLAPGDLVFPQRVMSPAGQVVDVSPCQHLMARAKAPVPSGLLITTQHVVATREAKAALFARTGALAVDMESWIILRAASSAGLPSLVARGVSDAARQSLSPELIDLLAADGRLRFGRAAALIARPALLGAALGVRRSARLALRAVADLLATLTR